MTCRKMFTHDRPLCFLNYLLSSTLASRKRHEEACMSPGSYQADAQVNQRSALP